MKSTLQHEECRLLLPSEAYILQVFVSVTPTFVRHLQTEEVLFRCFIQM
jgi:hypothetical protein